MNNNVVTIYGEPKLRATENIATFLISNSQLVKQKINLNYVPVTTNKLELMRAGIKLFPALTFKNTVIYGDKNIINFIKNEISFEKQNPEVQGMSYEELLEKEAHDCHKKGIANEKTEKVEIDFDKRAKDIETMKRNAVQHIRTPRVPVINDEAEFMHGDIGKFQETIDNYGHEEYMLINN